MKSNTKEKTIINGSSTYTIVMGPERHRHTFQTFVMAQHEGDLRPVATLVEKEQSKIEATERFADLIAYLSR